MSYEVIITCDHCAAKVPEKDTFSCVVWFGMAREKDTYGCSKEHLGLAVAKVFGVIVDGNMVALAKESNDRLLGWNEALNLGLEEGAKLKARIAELERYVTDGMEVREGLKQRIVDLEQKLREAHSLIDGGRLGALHAEGRVAYEAWKNHPNTIQAKKDRGCEYPDWEGLAAAEQDEWATIERAVIASLTGPKKPTKPAIEIRIETGGRSLTDPECVAALKEFLTAAEGMI
jgi:hypothetical protein